MNIDYHNFKSYLIEVFWMFFFFPIMANLITIVLMIVLHKSQYLPYSPFVFLGGYAISNLFFFMKYGRRKKQFHAGSE